MRSHWSAVVSLALPLLAACVTTKPSPDTGSPEEDCTPGDGPTRNVAATLTTIETVVRVTWETDAEVEARVVFEDVYGEAGTPRRAATLHQALLLGNPEDTEVPYRVQATVDDETWCGERRTITTGRLPVGLPDVTQSGAPEGGPRWTIAPIVASEEGFLTILDRAGRYVWATSIEEEGKPLTFYGAELALDGTALLANTSAASEDEPAPIHRVGLDGVLLDPIEVTGGHTDFVQLPDGGVVSLGWDVRSVGDRSFLGDTIVEVAPDGTERVIWSVWDGFTPDLSQAWTRGWYPGDLSVEDWSHVNGITYDPAEDDVLVTTTFDQSVLRVDRATGELVWRLGNEDGEDFDNLEHAELVSSPHAVQVVSGGVLLFNRGDFGDAASCSRAQEVALRDGAARPTWSWASERCLLIPFLGSAHRREDGTTMVDWTTAGQIDAVGPDGELAWRLNLDLGAGFTFADYVDALYPAE